MKVKQEAKLLRLWKIRQAMEGHDVSNVNSLAEAETFFDEVEKPLEAQKKEELLAQAVALGIEIDAKMKKSDLIKAIKSFTVGEEVAAAVEEETEEAEVVEVEEVAEEVV